MSSAQWQPGDTIVMRDASNGAVRSATPVRVLQHDSHRLVYCTVTGTRFFMRSAGRRTQGYDPNTAAFETHDWDGHGSLTVRDQNEGFCAKAFWSGPMRAFSCWYINLETGLVPTELGFDRRDQVLDVIIEPDLLTWRWKDEDEFEEAVRAGRIAPDEAAEIRAAGLRAVELARSGSSPFNEGWENWKPDPAWPIPVLPDGWERP